MFSIPAISIYFNLPGPFSFPPGTFSRFSAFPMTRQCEVDEEVLPRLPPMSNTGDRKGRPYAVVSASAHVPHTIAPKIYCHPERSEGSRMVTLTVLFTGFFTPSGFRMTDGQKRVTPTMRSPKQRPKATHPPSRWISWKKAPFRVLFSIGCFFLIFCCRTGPG